MNATLVCACGARQFRVRLMRHDQVGLLTCDAGHPSLLLDSRDYWFDVVQSGRPPESRCRCGGRLFETTLAYTFGDDGEVRSIDVILGCVACAKARVFMTLEIDYTPTQALVEAPLDPCPEPWLFARTRAVSAAWRPADAKRFIRFMASEPGVQCHFADWNERPRPCSADEACAAFAKARVFHLFFAVREVTFPERLVGAWRKLPLIQTNTPTSVNYATGLGILYAVEWAEQVFVEGKVVPHDPALLALAKRMRTWLSEHFVATRAPTCADNPDEYERLFSPRAEAAAAKAKLARNAAAKKSAKG